MIFASLETAVVLLIVGIALILIANRIHIDNLVNNILYIIGVIALIAAIIAFILVFTGMVI